MSTTTRGGEGAPNPLTPRRKRRAGPQDNASLIGHGPLIPYLFSAPAIVLVSLILAVPVFYGLYQSVFLAEYLGGPQEFVGFQNYLDLFSAPDFLGALGRTAVFVGGCLVLGTTLALLFAFALNRVVKSLRFLRAVTIAPYIVSSVAAAVMFRILFNRDSGQVNQVIEFLGFEGTTFLADPRLAMLVVVIAQVWTDLPLSVLVLLAGLQTIDPSYLDAAKVDGASGWNRARYISLPLIAPQIAISTVWLSYTVLTSLGVILALTGGGPLGATTTLPMELYNTAFTDLEMNEALALATFILILNALLTLGYVALGRRYEAS